MIPIIDFEAMRDPSGDRDAVARAVRAAGLGPGVFFAAGHGVPPGLIASHFELARAFFALDLERKRAIAVDRSDCFRGYEAFGTQTIDAAAPGDLKEGFIMGPDLPADHPHVLARYPNTGSNLWPDEPPDFRHRMERWVEAMNVLGRRIAAALALSLDLAEDYFAAALAEPLTYSQLLYYPSLPPGAGGASYGAGVHVDYGFLTILLQDDVGGLEVRAPDGSWHDVPPTPGTFVIIFGEMILRLTNGRYRSAAHRVRKNTSGRARYSMPTFFDPDYDFRAECVPTCAPAGGAPRYPALTVAEHMREMARAPLSAL